MTKAQKTKIEREIRDLKSEVYDHASRVELYNGEIAKHQEAINKINTQILEKQKQIEEETVKTKKAKK